MSLAIVPVNTAANANTQTNTRIEISNAINKLSLYRECVSRRVTPLSAATVPSHARIMDLFDQLNRSIAESQSRDIQMADFLAQNLRRLQMLPTYLTVLRLSRSLLDIIESFDHDIRSIRDMCSDLSLLPAPLSRDSQTRFSEIAAHLVAERTILERSSAVELAYFLFDAMRLRFCDPIHEQSGEFVTIHVQTLISAVQAELLRNGVQKLAILSPNDLTHITRIMLQLGLAAPEHITYFIEEMKKNDFAKLQALNGSNLAGAALIFNHVFISRNWPVAYPKATRMAVTEALRTAFSSKVAEMCEAERNIVRVYLEEHSSSAQLAQLRTALARLTLASGTRAPAAAAV